LAFHYSNEYLIHLFHLKIINEEATVTQQFNLHYKYLKHFFHLCLFADFTFRYFYELEVFFLQPMIHYVHVHLEMNFRINHNFNFHYPINYLSMHYYLIFVVIYNFNYHLLQAGLVDDCLHSIKLKFFVHLIIATFSF
jgi:hypothetical protein